MGKGRMSNPFKRLDDLNTGGKHMECRQKKVLISRLQSHILAYHTHSC